MADKVDLILFAPLLGALLCRAAHEAVTRRSAYIYFEELEPDLIDFAARTDDLYRWPGRPSLLSRLEIESPKREAITASDQVCNQRKGVAEGV